MVRPTGDWPPSTRPYRSNPPDGSVGIVLPIRDNLKFFKLAFHSILDFTDYRYMLTIVDNMSGFSTRQYLESIRRNHPVNVLQYQQTHAQGAEWNLALRFMFAFASVQYGVALTPDVVVEPNWLSSLVRTIGSIPDPVLISPHSNASMHDAHLHNEPVNALSPFCVAFRRSSYERLGGYNEVLHESEYVMRDMEDRARKAGFRLLCDHSLTMHHFTRSGYRPDAELVAADVDALKVRVAT